MANVNYLSSYENLETVIRLCNENEDHNIQFIHSNDIDDKDCINVNRIDLGNLYEYNIVTILHGSYLLFKVYIDKINHDIIKDYSYDYEHFYISLFRMNEILSNDLVII